MARADIKARLLATFRGEAEEHLRTLTGNLLALEQGVPAERAREVLEETFRAVHTLKGAARSVSLLDVEGLCQASELLLSRVVHGRIALSPAVLDLLQEAVTGVSALLAGQADPDAIGELVRRLDLAAGESASEAGDRPPPILHAVDATPRELAAADTIRLDARKLDAVLLQGEQLLTAKLAVEERANEARALLSEFMRSGKAVRSADSTLDHQAISELRGVENRARALVDRLAHDQRSIGDAVDRLLDDIRRTRMMPASTVLDLFPGMVRNLAREQAKEVDWSTLGAELELDRRVLETMKNPLIHLVRNAIDHGIEPRKERLEAGKPARGRVAVTVTSREDGRVEILVEDDGRGFDADRVRDAAVRTRAATAEAVGALDDKQALELAFRSGLSTSPVITDVSGHGLGLAIVREQVERLEGRIELTSGLTGTQVRMILPASIATFRGLLIASGSQRFLLPVQAAEQVLTVASEEIRLVEGREALSWRGRPVPVARLDALLRLAEPEAGSVGAPEPRCVIVASGEERVAILVDDVLGDQEVLVKEFSPPLVRVRHVAGAGLLGSGQIVLVLRPADLVKAGRHALPPAPVRTAPRNDAGPPLVLVVDDAVTTRTMERNLLEAAGYRVQVAVDGAAAWAALKTDDFDVVVSDVDMPRMNGFELTARIRADSQLEDLPVVLVTALESREDKERGIEVGANAYVVKSSFEQSNLLEIIRRLGIVAGSAARP